MRNIATIFVLALMLFITPGAVAFAAELAVPDGFKTINGAVIAASAGDTVIVGEGVYKENLIIKKNLILVARGSALNTIIEPVNSSAPTIKIIGVNGATLSGFTIKGSAVEGIFVEESRGVKLLKLRVIENETGIFLDHTNESTISGNIADLNQKGIYLYFSNNITIKDNAANTNINNGILLHASHNNVITGNETKYNIWNGITLSSSNNNRVTGNVSVQNAYAIVISESEGNEVNSNKTRRRIYIILPILLVYVGIAIYLVERKIFLIYYKRKYGEEL